MNVSLPCPALSVMFAMSAAVSAEILIVCVPVPNEPGTSVRNKLSGSVKISIPPGPTVKVILSLLVLAAKSEIVKLPRAQLKRLCWHHAGRPTATSAVNPADGNSGAIAPTSEYVPTGVMIGAVEAGAGT